MSKVKKIKQRYKIRWDGYNSTIIKYDGDEISDNENDIFDSWGLAKHTLKTYMYQNIYAWYEAKSILFHMKESDVKE